MKQAKQNVLTRGLASLPSEANSKKSSASNSNSHSTLVVKNEKKFSISNATPEDTSPSAEKKTTKKATSFTPVDIDVLRGLEQEYQAVAKLGDVNDNALRIWNRRAAWISVFLVLVYFAIGVVCFSYLAPDWDIPNTILFAVYSATSAGYGHLEEPQTPAFQVFDIFFIMFGIAGVAIMFAQVYQFLQLEAQKAHDKRKASELASSSGNETHKKKCSRHFWRFVECARPFFQETVLGRILSVFIPLCVILMSGALIIGSIEGWTFIECIYFGVASMTTVGYGDYYPTKTSAVWICIFWLPFNVVFTSIYMGSVASAYLHFSAKGVKRIRDRLKSKAAQETAFNRSISSPQGDESKRDRVEIEVGIYDYLYEEDSSMDIEDPPTLKTSDICTSDQKESIDDDASDSASQDAPIFVLENMTLTLTTMEDVVQAVHTYTEASLLGRDENGNDDGGNVTITESLGYLAVHPNSRQNESDAQSEKSQPCFALRVLVNERLAHIIARDIAGGSHNVDVQDACIVVRIGQWKNVVSKWNIPSGAWKAFRAAALNAIMLVGEHALIQHGASALFRLSPDEFHNIFSPLVAALGDAKTLEGWMKSTDKLAKASFNKEDNHLLTSQALEMRKKKGRTLTVSDDMVQMPKGPGTAFHK